MASDLEAKAKEVFVENHFELAVDLLTQAINLEPNKAELYADRAQANIKLNNFNEAVTDANKAIELNPSLPKAYLRKGTAYMKLKEYKTAKAALKIGASLSPVSPDNLRFSNLIKECNKFIAEESYAIPIQEKSTTEDITPKDDQHQDDLPEKPTVAVTKPKYRHEFYQKPDQAVVTIFAKKIPKESITVDFGEQILSVSINVPGEDAYVFRTHLFGKIVPSSCQYEVLSTKIEIRLVKAEPIHWTSLKFTRDIVVPQRVNASSDGAKSSSMSIEKKVEFFESLTGKVTNRRSRRWLNDRLLMELVPRLNAEEIRGLFAPPPWGDEPPPSTFSMTNMEEWDRFRNIDMDKEVNIIQALENSLEKRKGHIDVDKMSVLNGWHRIDCRTRDALRRSCLSELIDGYEECVRAFITTSTDEDVLELQIQDPFHRLLLHGVCEFYNLASETVTYYNGVELSKMTKVKKKKKGSPMLSNITLSHFLKMSKDGSW